MFATTGFPGPGLWMNWALPVLIDGLVKGVLLLSAASIGVSCWRRSSAAARHTVWTISMIGLLILPVLSQLGPRWNMLPDWTGGALAASAPTARPIEPRTTVNDRHGRLPVVGENTTENPDRVDADRLAALQRAESPSIGPPAVENQSASVASSRSRVPVSPSGPGAGSGVSVPPAVPAGPDRRRLGYAMGMGIWAAGAIALMLRLLMSQFSLWRLARRSCLVTEGKLCATVERFAASHAIRRPIRLLLSRDRQIPMTWGLCWPHLLLPVVAEQWDDTRLQSVLAHELAHTRRRDCQTQLLAQIACALHWPNPLAWFALTCMDRERERACDDVVLSHGIPAADYAEHLVGVASGLSRHELATYGAMTMARRSRLESRLLTVLDESLNRQGVSARLWVKSFLGVTLLMLPISMLHAVSSTVVSAEDGDDRETGSSVGAAPDQPSAQPPSAQPPSANGSVKQGSWSEPVDGLQLRLSSTRTDFESWELPTFAIEIRNAGTTAVTAARAEALIGELHKRPGLLFLFEHQHRRAPTNENRWLVPQIRFDAQQIVGLEPNHEIRQTVTLTSMREESAPLWEPYDLGPGRYTIGLGSLVAGPESRMLTTPVTLNILPPGIRRRDEWAAWLKPVMIETQQLEAGFIPNKTTLVWGERIFVTLAVRNPGDDEFRFGFGGDYRGSGRHDRFQIEATGAEGKPLPDPQEQRGGSPGDGILTWRTAQPHDVAVETVDMTAFRVFPGPGEYTVSCQFDLTPSPLEESRQRFSVPVKTSYKLTILPREPVHVQRVLDELWERSRQTGSGPLSRLIDTISSFGKEAAVPGLEQMMTTGDPEHRRAAAAGLGRITTAESLRVLLQAASDEQLAVRVAVVAALGHFADVRAVQAVVRALSDPQEEIRRTAAESLGSSKTDAGLDALIRELPNAPPSVSAAILRAMGMTKSPRVFEILERSLGSGDDLIRRAALDGILNYPSEQSVPALQPFATRGDMDFREVVIGKLAEEYKYPIDPRWLIPVIRSRKYDRSIGNAPRILRLHAGDKAAPTLLGCLDFENPDIRSYYNLTLIDNQLACGGLVIPWISDLNRDGTPEEIESNRRTLRQIQAWTDYFAAHPWNEPRAPWELSGAEEEATWSAPMKDLKIRVHVNRSVWPRGLPQVVSIEAVSASGGGSVSFNEPLKTCEVEVNGHWYARRPDAEISVAGSWHAYHGNPWHHLQLDRRWRRISDDEPLDLKPGRYTVRVRLSMTATDNPAELATSQPTAFEVIPLHPQQDP